MGAVEYLPKFKIGLPRAAGPAVLAQPAPLHLSPWAERIHSWAWLLAPLDYLSILMNFNMIPNGYVPETFVHWPAQEPTIGLLISVVQVQRHFPVSASRRRGPGP